MKNLQAFDFNYFIAKYFENDGSQNKLMCQPIYNTFTKTVGDTETIVAWKSKGLPDEIVNPPAASGNSLAPKLKWINNSKIEQH